jgi:hypothetical protein
VEIDGETAFVLAEDLDDLHATAPTKTVRLLAGFDQYVLGPGTDDPRVIPQARRWEVSKQSGWIAPVVLARGVVAGTWEIDGEAVRVAWFAEAGRPPRTALGTEGRRLSTILDRPLRMQIELR